MFLLENILRNCTFIDVYIWFELIDQSWKKNSKNVRSFVT